MPRMQNRLDRAIRSHLSVAARRGIGEPTTVLTRASDQRSVQRRHRAKVPVKMIPNMSVLRAHESGSIKSSSVIETASALGPNCLCAVC